MATETVTKQPRAPRKSRKATGDTEKLGALAAKHDAEHIKTPAEAQASNLGSTPDVEVLPPSTRELANTVNEEFAKREDAMDAFLRELPADKRKLVRAETSAFLKDWRGAAEKVGSAMSHLYNIYTKGCDGDIGRYMEFEKAFVRMNYVSAGTAWTLREKIIALEKMALPSEARVALLTYSNGDSLIVRRSLTDEEIAQWKQQHPATKVPKGTYEASPFVTEAMSVIEPPSKWSPDVADSWAGRVVRLATKIRGKARSGADTSSSDERAVKRFSGTLDTLQVLISGDAESEYKGKIVLADTDYQNELFCDAVEVIVSAVLSRIPLKVANDLYSKMDTLFESAITKMEQSNGTHRKQKEPKAA